MQSDGTRPDTASFNTLMDSYAQWGRWEGTSGRCTEATHERVMRLTRA